MVSLYTTLGTISDAYDETLSSLSAAYVEQSKRLLSALSPSDWWNDGVAWGYSAQLAYWYMLYGQQARGYGIANATQIMNMFGGSISDPVGGDWLPARANTDPQRIAMKTFDQYRHQSTLTPDIRPIEWPKPDEGDWKLVQSWLDDSYNRMNAVSDTDTMRAGDMAARETYERAGVTQYRRVIHPELSKTGTCGLCAVAATNRYSIRDLKPMHFHCHCTVMPILGSNDPGAYLNNLDLDEIYRKAGSTKGADLAKLHVQVTEHGELGPILNEYNQLAETQGESHSATAKFNREHYRQPDRQMAVQQLTEMLDRSQRLLSVMQEVKDSGKEDRIVEGDRELRIKPSRSLTKAITYQKEFARQLRSMLNLSA